MLSRDLNKLSGEEGIARASATSNTPSPLPPPVPELRACAVRASRSDRRERLTDRRATTSPRHRSIRRPAASAEPRRSAPEHRHARLHQARGERRQAGERPPGAPPAACLSVGERTFTSVRVHDKLADRASERQRGARHATHAHAHARCQEAAGRCLLKMMIDSQSVSQRTRQRPPGGGGAFQVDRRVAETGSDVMRRSV